VVFGRSYELSGLFNRVAISAGSVRFFIDNARMALGGWACGQLLAQTHRLLSGCGAQRRCFQSSTRRAWSIPLRWPHKAEPPDFELVVVQDVGWVNTANLTLPAELRRRAPQAIDWRGMAGRGAAARRLRGRAG
jgi:hypothetical protein